MKMAEKFRLPVITFIDTPGAFRDRRRGARQSEAIARNLLEMSHSRPRSSWPSSARGERRALAIGVGDEILMMEYSVYSVISPRVRLDPLARHGQGRGGAEMMKITAPD